MPLYIIKAPVKHGGKLRRDGEIELSAEQAAPAVKGGFLAEPDTSATESGKGKAPAAGSSAAGAEPNGSGAKPNPVSGGGAGGASGNQGATAKAATPKGKPKATPKKSKT